MKKFLLIFVISSQLLLSQNSINISSDPVSVDEDFSIGIAFSNTDDISAFQFDLQFDNFEIELLSPLRTISEFFLAQFWADYDNS